MAILNADGKPAPKVQGPHVPTVTEAEEMLNAYMAQLMVLFRNNGVQGFVINSIGRLLAALIFEDDKRQTPGEVAIMIHKEAEALVENIRVWMLRQSIASTDPTKLN